MKKIASEDSETKSADIIAANIEKLKEIFPAAFREGQIDFEVLKQELGGLVDEREEKYGLNWHGKRKARQLALTPSTGTLRPCPEESVDWTTTQNLMIEGDNLEVLKLLQKSYAGNAKLIYIDPPYNTGRDFIYKDDYQDNIKNYKMLTNQIASDGRKFLSNAESSGRFHTDWLNMMYPRLKLAQSLLKPEGAIVISIGDKEIDNLRKICSEIFGEENLVATAVWEKKNKGAFLASDITNMKDYVVIYCRDKVSFNGLIGQIAEEEETYPCVNAPNAREIRIIPAGIKSNYREKNFLLESGKTISVDTMNLLLHSNLVIKEGVLAEDLTIEGNWRYKQEAMTEYAEKGELYLTQDLYLRRIVKEPRLKTLRDLFPRLGTSGQPASSALNPNDLFVDGWGTNEDANEELRQLLGEQNLFDYPKPLQLITKLICSIRDKNALVLDFFSGSGTTGHATLRLNAIDGGQRRFILVQLPEMLDIENEDQKLAAQYCDRIGKPRNISELTKERLRRAGKKLKEENPMFAGDLGFRVFKLDSSNIRTWEPNRDNLTQTLQEATEHLKAGRTEKDILFELLLKLGLDLTVPIEEQKIAGKKVHSIGAGSLLVCLAEKISRSEVEPLAQGIVVWHKQLAPAGETQTVFRDSAFADDVAKTNLTAILQQNGIENVRSL